jgi:hypothetical protein
VDARGGGDGDAGGGEDGVRSEVVHARGCELDELDVLGEGGDEAGGGEIGHRRQVSSGEPFI